ncbi:type II toxin-antitoxin system PemK/MazF family toxin [Bacillus canaveralius]|uniref:type II toxin-antitoxin system PemK/MazF family toxin n=1 Tax=Bacillus canaveralius TaxID=1403243 RepID=UPI000F79D0BC|nr:type II toxin-antitoxin system PemK/MazF family toxin [Bacillus canaveralius]RSK56635.1 hypothetical protein EJA13_02005 [Bacillus canaveralius]
MNYDVGDIYYVDIAFEDDQTFSKERPVVVIDVEDGDILILTISEITTTAPNTPPKYHDQFKSPINNYGTAGLSRMSYVKAHKLKRIPESALKTYVGKMEETDLYNAIVMIADNL